MASIANRIDKLEAIYGTAQREAFRLCVVVDGASDEEVEAFARQHGFDPANEGHVLVRMNIIDPAGVAPVRDGPKVRVLH